LAAALIHHAPAAAQDSPRTETLPDVVVTTPGRMAQPLAQTGSAVTVVTREELATTNPGSAIDALRSVPGVDLSETGGPGGTIAVRLRGASPGQTLVMIDGIRVNDPSGAPGEFDFSLLPPTLIERIEVLRGPQSALYGSDAIGGVINYITLSGREAPGGRVRMEGGSFGTKEASARYAGVSGPFDYALSGGYSDVDGFPVARFGSRDLGTQNTAVSGRLEYTPSDTLRFKAIARYSHTKADVDDQDFNFPPGPTFGFVVDSDDYYKNRALYGLVRGELDTFDAHWTHAVSVQGVDASRDSFSGGAFDFGDNGKRIRYSYESTFRFGAEAFAQTLTAAFDHEREEFQNLGAFLLAEQVGNHAITNKGIVLQYDARINDRIGIGAAVRHDENDRFDNDDTYRVQASFRVTGTTRLRATAGTGIKNPGIFDLFGFDPGSFVGNPGLGPEKSRGWEVGADQSFADRRGLVGITYFSSKLKDEIISTFDLTTFESSAGNAATDSTQKGVEVFAQARIAPAWRIDASYTYVNARQNGVEEARRPPHIGSLNIGWRAPEDRAGVALTVRYNGSTNDNDFTSPFAAGVVRLSSYTLVNLGADYRLANNVQLYGRVENLFDEDYEDVYTYRSAGRGAFAGARFSF
jgi:vitamin B12 transporter